MTFCWYRYLITFTALEDDVIEFFHCSRIVDSFSAIEETEGSAATPEIKWKGQQLAFDL